MASQYLREIVPSTGSRPLDACFGPYPADSFPSSETCRDAVRPAYLDLALVSGLMHFGTLEASVSQPVALETHPG